MSHPAFEVSRRHLFINSTDRSRSPFTISDDGKLRIDLDTLGETAHAEDNQFIRLSLLLFSMENMFDRHLAPANQFFMYIGSAISPATPFNPLNPTQLQAGTLVPCKLLGARYDRFANVMLDLTNAVASSLQLLYPTANYTYSVTRLSGNGLRYATTNGSVATQLGDTSTPLNFTPQIPESIDDLGEFRQSGTRILTSVLKIQYTGGGAHPAKATMDNTTDERAFGFIFENNNNCYKTCGATPAAVTAGMSYLQTAAFLSTGLGIAPDSLTTAALGSLNGSFSFETTAVTDDTLVLTIANRCPMQLDVSNMVYLRTNAIGKQYETANFSSDTAQDPAVVQSSQILAAIPAQLNTLYYNLSGGEPVFTIDLDQRTLHQLEIYLTNEYGDTQWRSNAYTLSYFLTNISFMCALRLSVFQKPVTPTAEDKFDEDKSIPARFVSQPMVFPDHGADRYVDNVNTLLARRV